MNGLIQFWQISQQLWQQATVKLKIILTDSKMLPHSMSKCPDGTMDGSLSNDVERRQQVRISFNKR